MPEQNKNFAELFAEAHRSMEEEFRRFYELDETWHYREWPWTNHAIFDLIFEIIGSENVRFVSRSERGDWPDGPHYRGTFMISQAGIENIQNGRDRISAHFKA